MVSHGEPFLMIQVEWGGHSHLCFVAEASLAQGCEGMVSRLQVVVAIAREIEKVFHRTSRTTSSEFSKFPAAGPAGTE